METPNMPPRAQPVRCIADVDQTVLAAVRSATCEAGRIALRHFRGTHQHWEKSPGQIVTEVDLAIDAHLRRRLLALRPGAGWLSEETLDDGTRLTRAEVWVVDPIDGTRAFAAGDPEFTICVGLLVAGRPALAVVLNPATGELFEARAGAGARLNNRPITVSPVDRLAGARIGISRTERRRAELLAALPEAQPLTIGSLAYKLALTAAGRLDGYVSLRRAHDWDLAAAELILTEAGGVVSDALGEPISYLQPEPWRRGLVAAPARLHPQLCAGIGEIARR
jgi:myo-inositol-1(or 4)-monophosphatase